MNTSLCHHYINIYYRKLLKNSFHKYTFQNQIIHKHVHVDYNSLSLRHEKQITQYKGLAVFGHSLIYNIAMYILKLINEKFDIYLTLIYVNMNTLKCLYVNWSPHNIADHEDI